MSGRPRRRSNLRNQPSRAKSIPDKGVYASEHAGVRRRSVWDHDAKTSSDQLRQRLSAIPSFQRPLNLSDLSDEEMLEYDAVFIPGGYGPMVDLAENPDVLRLLRMMHNTSRIVAALGHGPAALLSAPHRADGLWLFDGYRMTGFTDEEEYQTHLGKLGMPWHLEAALKNRGAVFDDALAAWTSHVVVDRAHPPQPGRPLARSYYRPAGRSFATSMTDPREG
jgi:putative intracellular protease/amidase